MKLTDAESRSEIIAGDSVIRATGETYIYKGIVQAPRAVGNNGGPSTGRIMVVDADGNRLLPDPHPFEFRAVIEV